MTTLSILQLVCLTIFYGTGVQAQSEDQYWEANVADNCPTGNICSPRKTSCVGVDKFCHADTYSNNPAVPLSGDRSSLAIRDVSQAFVCQKPLRCRKNSCVQPVAQDGDECCSKAECESYEHPTKGMIGYVLCEDGLNCVDNGTSITGICEPIEPQLWLQFDDPCDPVARPSQQCISPWMACDPTAKKCRYFNPDCTGGASRGIENDFLNCSGTTNPWNTVPYERNGLVECDADSDCKYGSFCSREDSDKRVCRSRDEDGKCDFVFRNSNSANNFLTGNPGAHAAFTAACPHNKICLRKNVYGDMVNEEGSVCSDPFRRGEGEACPTSTQGSFYCQKGLRCMTVAGARAMCVKPPPLNCDFGCNDYSSSGNFQLGCPKHGYNAIAWNNRERACIPRATTGLADSWIKWKWDNGEKKFRDCLEQYKCQLTMSNSYCAVTNGCVKYLKDGLTIIDGSATYFGTDGYEVSACASSPSTQGGDFSAASMSKLPSAIASITTVALFIGLLF